MGFLARHFARGGRRSEVSWGLEMKAAQDWDPTSRLLGLPWLFMASKEPQKETASFMFICFLLLSFCGGGGETGCFTTLGPLFFSGFVPLHVGGNM